MPVTNKRLKLTIASQYKVKVCSSSSYGPCRTDITALDSSDRAEACGTSDSSFFSTIKNNMGNKATSGKRQLQINTLAGSQAPVFTGTS